MPGEQRRERIVGSPEVDRPEEHLIPEGYLYARAFPNSKNTTGEYAWEIKENDAIDIGVTVFPNGAIGLEYTVGKVRAFHFMPPGSLVRIVSNVEEES